VEAVDFVSRLLKKKSEERMDVEAILVHPFLRKVNVN